MNNHGNDSSRVDARVLVTDLANPAQGAVEPGRFITDLVLEPSGTLLIGTAPGDGGVGSAIYRVNPASGERSLLSDLENWQQGTDVGDLSFSTGLAIERSGALLAASGGSVAAPRNLLLRIDSTTGRRSVATARGTDNAEF